MTYQAELNGTGPRGKRSWGDRLRMGLPKGAPPDGPGPGGGGNYLLHEYRGGSALSRSMKYAETWLYTPPQPIVAVVMCSCPEFLAGTTRAKKMASVCKKCGGARRPMPTTVGTVRGYGTVSQPARVRPSVLADPYDLMRRSRMASSSPPRRRRARSSSPPLAPGQRREVDEWALVGEGRKSILECEVNPYDLISKYLGQNHSCSDGGESSDNLSDNALEDLMGPSRARPEMTTFGKGPQNSSPLGPKEDLSCKLNSSKQSVSHEPTKSKAISSRKTESPASPSGGVTISGQRIRIFSGDHEEQPKRPPRKWQRCRSLAIKSILKRSQADPSPSPEGSVSSATSQLLLEKKKQVQFQEGALPAESGGGRPLRRSLSERLVSTPDGDGAAVFNDTMRLLLRAARPSSRVVFSGRMGSPPRPRDPPPPPPLPAPSAPQQGSCDSESRDVDLPPASSPLGERPVPIGRPQSDVQSLEELARETWVRAAAPEVHRLQIKHGDGPDCDGSPPSLDIDALAQRTTSIFINCDVLSPPALILPPSSTPDRQVLGNKVTISLGSNDAGDIDYEDVPFGATDDATGTSTPRNATDLKSLSPPTLRPVVIPVAHLNHCSRVNIGDKSDERRSSTKMTVRICPTGASGDGSGCPSSDSKPSEPTETINLLIQESVDPVDAVRRNLVPHVCGGGSDPPLHCVREEALQVGGLPPSAVSAIAPAVMAQGGKGKSGADIMREVLSLGKEDACNHEKETGRSKFYTWVDSTSSVEMDNTHEEDELTGLATTKEFEDMTDDENHYEMIRDPIYEEIRHCDGEVDGDVDDDVDGALDGDVDDDADDVDDDEDDVPPPLPLSPPPDIDTKLVYCRSMFEGASKDDILSYLVDAKERGIVPEEMYFGGSSTGDDSEDSHTQHSLDLTELSHTSDSSEDSVNLLINDTTDQQDDSKARRGDIERNDSGLGSETSRASRSRWRRDQRRGCQDCTSQVLCRRCAERREIIQELVETEEKFAGDLHILLEEFYRPMLVAGLLPRSQLAAIFLNADELLVHARALADRLRDALEMAAEQGDEDLVSEDIGRLFLAATPMLRAFEHYCTRQAGASLLLASLEKERELLRVFLRVSQMENSVLRRMNLNSFLMVPVQRVTKYPLLLARLCKVTPVEHPARELLEQAQRLIELHLEHMNSVATDISSTKLWRRMAVCTGRRVGAEADIANMKLRKMAAELLDWTRDVSFPMEGRLLFAQPRGRTLKLNPVSALLVTLGEARARSPEPEQESGLLRFPAHSGARAASLLLLKEKGGRYSLVRDPLFLDKCMVCCEVEWEDYFEVQELATKDSFIFKAEDASRTRAWYSQLQLHAQGLGPWRRRRNALANIMINGMQLRA